MPGATIRISNASRNILRKLAAQEGESMQSVLEKAIETYRRQHFLKEINKAYSVLRQNHEAWTSMEKELAEWDATLGDGLESDEEWAENGKAIRKGKGKKRL
jgi:hypothetical protein